MIMVTGGTGFIGQALVKQLLALGKPVRILLRPSQSSPQLPKGMAVEVAVCSLNDERGLRAAMKDVDIVYHLAGSERKGSKAQLSDVDINGTRAISEIVSEAGVRQLIYLSHLGADRASAFAILKSKAIAEGFVSQSGVPYTIVRSGVAFGPGDQFTTSIAKLLKKAPGFIFLPGDGSNLVQPIWINDLVNCLAWVIEDKSLVNQTISIGGGEFFTFKEVVEIIKQTISVRKILLPLSPAYIRTLTLWLEQFSKDFPISIYWLDYFASNRTCSLDTLPRLFGIMPARFAYNLDYLKE
jgi:NADH dehydrogenase